MTINGFISIYHLTPIFDQEALPFTWFLKIPDASLIFLYDFRLFVGVCVALSFNVYKSFLSILHILLTLHTPFAIFKIFAYQFDGSIQFLETSLDFFRKLKQGVHALTHLKMVQTWHLKRISILYKQILLQLNDTKIPNRFPRKIRD